MEQVLNFLPWVLPPLIGAAIGYITNAIAITMLFRPHNEKRFLSVRLPMTPGIIPKQRYELSESVGNMVSRELLTEDAVRKQIQSKSFLMSVDRSLGSFLDLLIDTPVSELKDKFINSTLKIKTSSDLDESFLPELLSHFMESAGLKIIIENLLDKGFSYLEEKNLNQIFPDKKEVIVKKFMSVLLSSEALQRFLKITDKWFEKAVHDNYHLLEVLTEENITRLVGISGKLYKRLFPHFINFLKSEEIKNELEVHGRTLLKDILNKLNRIQRFLLSAGQYDKTLDDNMLEIVDDTIKNLQDFGSSDNNIIKMENGLKRRLISFSQITAGELISEWDGDIFEDIHSLEQSIFDILSNPVIASNIEKSLDNSYEKYGNMPLGLLFDDLFSLNISNFKTSIISFFFPDSNEKKRNSHSTNFITGILRIVSLDGGLSFQNIFAIPSGLRERIKTSLTGTLIGIVDNRVPQILESIDVNTLVVDKINTLDMEKVEKLILDIVKKQLRWINLFGALLGSVIGGAQLMLNMFM